MTQLPTLANYNAAITALAAANKVDEVKKIHDEAMMLKLYGKLAKDDRIQRYGVALRVRAERRLGQLMAAQAEAVGKAKGADRGGRRPIDGSRRNPSNAPPTLAEAGIDKPLAQRARKAARMSEPEFAEAIKQTLDPPPKPARKKARKRNVFDAVSVPVRDVFEFNARQAAALADDDYSGLAVDEELLTLGRAVIDAWTRCLSRLEDTHGEAKG